MLEDVFMEENVIQTYLNRIVHLRSARKYVNDLWLIESTLRFFDYDEADQVIGYIAVKYRKDINAIGRMLTGVMVLTPAEAGEKDDVDLYNDLCYLRDCLIVFAAVHSGVEKSLHSAIVKISKEQKQEEYA